MGVAHSLTSKVPLPSLSYLLMIAAIGSSPKLVPVAFAMSSAATFAVARDFMLQSRVGPRAATGQGGIFRCGLLLQ